MNSPHRLLWFPVIVAATAAGMFFGILTFPKVKAPIQPRKSASVPAIQRIPEPTRPVEVEDTFIRVTEQVKNAVVRIKVDRPVPGNRGSSGQQGKGLRPEDLEEWLESPYLPLPQEKSLPALGSGVIISPQGYVLTNQHVVQDGQQVMMVLSDGTKCPGEVVGVDVKTDLALLKMKVIPANLCVASMGDSDQVRVGEWVIAIGSPFDYGQTVTAGIVSAVGRSNVPVPADMQNYANFIQTDAAINLGSSGGPLINLSGEVIGINTAIATSGDGSMSYQGIAFAIPVNVARKVADALMQDGRVVRSWLGISIQDLTEGLVGSFDPPPPPGVLITGVFKGYPADQAGFKTSDVLIEVDGIQTETAKALQMVVADIPVGKTVGVRVWRGGQVLSLDLTTQEQPEHLSEVSVRPKKKEDIPDALGIRVRPLSEDVARRLGMSETTGLFILSIEPGSDSDVAGLKPGDVIMEIDGTSVEGQEGYDRLVKQMSIGRSSRFLVWTSGHPYFYAVTLKDRDKARP